MSDSPSTDALIEYRKSIRRDWDGAIDAEINRAFRFGYLAGQCSNNLPRPIRSILVHLDDYFSGIKRIYDVDDSIKECLDEYRRLKA